MFKVTLACFYFVCSQSSFILSFMTRVLNFPLRAALVLLFCMFSLGLYAQRVALKTNALYWATASPNLGLDVRLSRRLTLDVEGNAHLLNVRRLRSRWVAFTPEMRYWFSARPWAGHAVGLTGLAADYKLTFRGTTHEGQAYGVGPTYSYAWVFRDRWSLEAVVGAGLMRVSEKKYSETLAETERANNKRWLFAPLKVGLNVVFLIR